MGEHGTGIIKKIKSYAFADITKKPLREDLK